MQTPAALSRRARPLLGTLVEIGCDRPRAFDAGFAAVERVQRCMSRFDALSDLGRFRSLALHASIEVDPWTAEVLQAAQALRDATQGAFDVSLGSGPHGWCCAGRRLTRLDVRAQLDLGGIAKGYAVDCAVMALQAEGVRRGWVNAGGDLRVFGDLDLPVTLRDERGGGVRPFGMLRDGALATSRFAADSRSRHADAAVHAHVSVLAPQCLWADALTKLAAAGPVDAALLQRHGAQAWAH